MLSPLMAVASRAANCVPSKVTTPRAPSNFTW